MQSINDDRIGEQAAEVPAFMRPLPSGWTDFWCPDYSSSHYADNLTLGEKYAEAAVRHARNVQDPMAVELVMTTITHKILKGQILLGPIEIGFFHRVAQLAYVGSFD